MPRHWQGQTEQQNHSSIAGWHWDSQMIVFCECGLTVPFERTSTCSSEDLFMSRLVWTQLNSTLLSNMAYILDIWHEWNFSPLSPTLCKHWCVSSLSVKKIHPLLPCNIPPSRVLALLFVLQQSQFLEVAGGCKQRAQCGVPLVQLWELLQVHLCSFWVLSIQMHMQPLKTRDRSDGTLEPWISFFGLDFFFWFLLWSFFLFVFFFRFYFAPLYWAQYCEWMRCDFGANVKHEKCYFLDTCCFFVWYRFVFLCIVFRLRQFDSTKLVTFLQDGNKFVM